MDIRKFKLYNVISRGHFLLSSGRHSKEYINKDAIYSFPDLFACVIDEFSTILRSISLHYDVITGPAIAGAIIAAPLSIKLNKRFVYPEKAEIKRYFSYPIKKILKVNVMKFNRGYDKVLKNKRVVVVEDVITTGGSVRRTIDAIKLCGGECVCVLAIWNRGSWKPKGVELISLINEPVISWTANECPLCKNNITLTDPKTEEIKNE